ncbi:helix-turn-helix transcriptional regulator [Actinophytocola gossypii]|uniref:Response regulator transcription factor n=1 Tax=Actinophytocola gossypii TaxID=2812003 RepID=A0ABT2J7X3_9PSEU|nr:LuxR C-terminal-related transcriptional regulator [Actinophytocola gossypii]MCT2583876.1 response regulator transcription factor [Actinophytocola gossypii]
MTDRELALPILMFPHFLARALTAALDALGWQIREHATALSRRIVLVADDDGALPVSPAVAAQVVVVGGLNSLDSLVGLCASAAVNADLPFGEVVRGVDAALRAGPAPVADRERRQHVLRARRAESARFERLTDREAAVLADLVRGLSAAEIARGRPVALATVRTQIAAVLHKLRVRSQAAAIAMAYRSCCDRRVLPAIRFHQNY